MKKIVFIFCMACLLWDVSPLYAQAVPAENRFSYGLKAGMNLSSLFSVYADNRDIHYIPGVMVGIFGEYRFTPVFGLSLGVNYSGEGAKISNVSIYGVSVEPRIRLNKLNIPLLANFYLGQRRRFALKVGLEPSVLLQGKMEIAGKTCFKERKYYVPFVPAVSWGMSYDFSNGLLIEGRWSLGYNGDDGESLFLNDSYNSAFALAVGYRFNRLRSPLVGQRAAEMYR